MQVASLVGGLGAQGPTVRGACADLRHPLLSQPVMEFCLGIPTLRLTRGGRDRGLARDAFAARLPAFVAARRSKGRLSAHYGRMIAAALPGLRDLLLKGRLVDLGVLDPIKVDAALRAEALMWRGGYGAIVQAALAELWLRAWEGRLKRLRPGPAPQALRGSG